MTTGKTIALTRWTLVGKVMCLLFNRPSRLVITFHPRSKRLFISWLQSPSAVILEPRKTKSDIVSTVSPSTSHEVIGPCCWTYFSDILVLPGIQKAVVGHTGSRPPVTITFFWCRFGFRKCFWRSFSILSVGRCHLPVAGHNSSHLQGSHLLC